MVFHNLSNAIVMFSYLQYIEEEGNPFEMLAPVNRKQRRHPYGMQNRDFGHQNQRAQQTGRVSRPHVG